MRQIEKVGAPDEAETACSAGSLEGRALLTAAQMRAAEQEAIAAGTTGAALMERAGAETVAALLAHWPDLAAGPGRAAVLCGPGGNGGDGYVVARLLRARGWEVRLHALAPATQADAKAQAEGWARIGAIGDWADAAGAVAQADLVIDALFGTGLARPLGDEVAPVIAAMRGRRVLAVDLPSGLCSDSGRVIGTHCVEADLTVGFHAPKAGQVLDRGPAQCGALALRDIGLAEGDAVARITAAPQGLGKRAGHKYGHGHALVLAGGPGRGGAVRMAAQAALRIGAGLVTLGCPPAALQENAARLDAVMLRPLRDAGALQDMLGDARLNALCLGPGLGVDRAGDLVAAALSARRATLLDADALTAIAEQEELAGQLHDACLLTPHDGEFARLCPDLSDRLRGDATSGPAFSRIDAAAAAARRLGAVVLLKGPDTVIAAPDGRVAVNAGVYDRAAPWLATAGAGDVLSGICCGLMARGFAPYEAACAGAWLHVAAARRFGPGLIAEDLPATLPAVLRQLLS
ncbi:NAD(P)H-hydrate dehydratase [Limimaricola pyoseonensis]|uniref:Bifunctional NAD(P)H-hydrate repair enzyme n=1 Tax=Limimaricola pyoseonensis TaxID=521013 RepID=A0A1G6ZWD4_9RHOB|nr:NAD(P)H-hydrate dehydratase [Limimaricola pyoseonensis]SDE05936.1 yjeF C-terminal region, hydroxyethylthiazole kinase-related/yjeF N-terminal region [Limimaricola pyoseonensis]